MELWDQSQLAMEKSAFEGLNISDRVLNMSKEGTYLTDKLQEYYKKCSCGLKPDDKRKIQLILNEIECIFHGIKAASAEVNEISHTIEGETAHQKEIKEDIQKSLHEVRESIDSAVACAELMLAEL
jgi:methyl-accepting chemotaxis protein